MPIFILVTFAEMNQGCVGTGENDRWSDGITRPVEFEFASARPQKVHDRVSLVRRSLYCKHSAVVSAYRLWQGIMPRGVLI
jgi:hypothetical protein